MKKITTLLTLSLFLLMSTAYAQHVHSERCGHNILKKSLEEKYPGYTETLNKTFEEAQAIGETLRLSGRAEVLTIPVAFHVVYHQDEPEQNIADSIIEDQLRVLNEDYRMLNEDADNLRDEFDIFVADAEIEF